MLEPPAAGAVVFAQGCLHLQRRGLRPSTFDLQTCDLVTPEGQMVVSGRRHEARITVLQALYEIDAAEHGADEVLERYLGNAQMPPGTRRFIERLVRGVLAERERLDAIIAKTAPTWPVAQLPAIDRTILRMALWELLIERDVPVKAVINEAVELAKRFGGDNSGRFVNGVLGTVVTEQRPDAAGID